MEKLDPWTFYDATQSMTSSSNLAF